MVFVFLFQMHPEHLSLQFPSLEQQSRLQSSRREDWVGHSRDQVTDYWNTPFNKIYLGMKIGQQFKSVVINHQARSLHSLIADGKYGVTSLGRNTWKKVFGSRASLQTNCKKEGFNAICTDSNASKARIGIIGNNENGCSSCDSRIGFGTGGFHDDSNTCGNDGAQHIKAMGYILVQ